MGDRVIVITGPTATGKTDLGIELAIRLGGEIVSADSMQVYKGFDIGTAKVTAAEARGIRHHLIDVAQPFESFSVSRYVELAEKAVRDVFARGRVPIIVGGTGLYIDSLLSGRSFAPVGTGDAPVREDLMRKYDCVGGEAFWRELCEIDPERAEKLHPSDKKRLVRAMEVYTLTGKTITRHDEETRLLPPRFESLRLALTFSDRQRLYERIDRRVDLMVEAGLFEEVENLLKGGLDADCTAMQAIGYKEAAAFLRGERSRGDTIEEIKRASRRYAKRQLTWLARDKALHWIVWEEAPDTAAGLERILEFMGE